MTIEITIERLGHLGDGIAPGPVFAPGALPGETVSGTLDGDRLRDSRIVTPSPHRVRPPCRHAKSCGGCALQHASDAFVENWKSDVVRTALSAQGIKGDIAGVATSAPGSRRRTVLHGQKTKKGSIIGLFAPESDRLVDISDCRVLAPGIMDALPALADLVRLGGSRKATLDLAVTTSEAGLDVSVQGGKPLDQPLLEGLAQLAGQHDLARLTWGDETVAMARPPFQHMGAARVVPPPGAFLQATSDGEAALVAEVLRLTEGAKSVLDLFAGCGTFSLPIASHAAVHMAEGLPGLLKAAEKGWREAGGLHKLTTETRDLNHRPFEPVELTRFDAVVLDPPRAGALAQAQALAQSQISQVACVSCNPVTFARDAKVLVDAGFEMDPILVVDQFRWSPHIELVTGFRR